MVTMQSSDAMPAEGGSITMEASTIAVVSATAASLWMDAPKPAILRSPHRWRPAPRPHAR
jgi:shikimate kinase